MEGRPCVALPAPVTRLRGVDRTLRTADFWNR